MDELNVNVLIGKTLKSVVNTGDEQLDFTTTDGEVYRLYHDQDCCESVNIEDICGNLDDLVDVPILIAEESTSDTNPEGVTPEYQDSFTWTFYKFATVKGYVTIRWYGESNGYYSESVNFRQLNPLGTRGGN